MKIIFLDTGTTSAGEDRKMIQLAYRIFEDSKLIKTYNEYFFEEDLEISTGAKAIHNITEDILKSKGINLKDKQIFAEIHTDLLGAYIIAHNSDFDKKTLELEGF